MIIGQKTYAISNSNIHSVGVNTYDPKLFLSAFFLLVALVWSDSVAMSPIETYSKNMAVGMVIGMAGLIFLILSIKPLYSVRIRSFEGELNIFASHDKNSIERIAKQLIEQFFLGNLIDQRFRF